MLCGACGKDFADEFRFCPYCGSAVEGKPSATDLPIRSDVPTSGPNPEGVVSTSTGGVQAGTVVFGAFAAVSLLVSIIRGIVPIYLLEAAGWAALAWYWQRKRAHSEAAKAIVGTLAVMVALGEVIKVGSQWDAQPAPAPVVASSGVNADGLPIVESADASATSRDAPAPPPSPPPGFVVDAHTQNAPLAPPRGVADIQSSRAAHPVALTECPSSLPSGATARPLPRDASDGLIGKQFGDLSSERTFNSFGDDYLLWSLDLDFTNNADTCVVMAVIEVQLSYKGKNATERHTVAFSPLLGSHKNQGGYSTVKLNIRTTERGESPALVGWRTVGVSGFELQDESAPSLRP